MKVQRKLAAPGIAFAALALSCSGGVGNQSTSASNPMVKPMDSMGTQMIAPTDPPDDEVSFANDIQPIFNARCTACHRPPTPNGGLDLTEGNSYTNLVNVPTSAACRQQVPDSLRVATCDAPPCDPSLSMIWAKTLPDAPPPDGRRCRATMPFNMPPLRELCGWDFHLLEQWIINGAPNN